MRLNLTAMFVCLLHHIYSKYDIKKDSVYIMYFLFIIENNYNIQYTMSGKIGNLTELQDVNYNAILTLYSYAEDMKIILYNISR